MAIVINGCTFDPYANAWIGLGTFQVPPPTISPTPSPPATYDVTGADYDAILLGSVGGIRKAIP